MIWLWHADFSVLHRNIVEHREKSRVKRIWESLFKTPAQARAEYFINSEAEHVVGNDIDAAPEANISYLSVVADIDRDLRTAIPHANNQYFFYRGRRAGRGNAANEFPCL